MKKQSKILISRVLFSFFLVAGYVCTAQVIDNFSDGDYSSGPQWIPDNAPNWIIDNNRLRSNSQIASSTFYITTSSSKATNAQWEFFINLQLNTSSANYVDVFLVSEIQNLSGAGNNGYFVRIGGTPDEVSLYKVTNGLNSILVNGVDGLTNSSNSTLKIKVIRDEANLWTLFYDNTGTGNSYVAEPSVIDNTFTSSNFFGVKVTQSTASFFNKHFFDDFYVGDIVIDNEPPTIVTLNPISSNELQVIFSEKVEKVSAETTSNYSLNNGIGQPQTATLQADEKTVNLLFLQDFPNAVNSQLTIINVKDLFNNAIISLSENFFFFEAAPVNFKDIVITEIFSDPSPSVGLPDAEFLEIFNRSQSPFQLQNWTITDGSSTGSLPNKIIMPGEYVILCSTGSVSLLNSFGAAIGITNFPTLNNSGDALILRDNASLEVDKVSYTDNWYKDEDKKQGGYSLELIDPENICAEEENWIASESTSGGTPGNQNSVFANKPDLTGPKLVNAIPISATEVVLKFNEKLSEQLPEENIYSILPAISVTTASFNDVGLREIKLTLSTSLQQSINYNLTLNNIFDCAGNLIHDDFKSASFGLPGPPEPSDIVINELLFNPRPFGVDFIEVYNRSTKYLNLKNWGIGNYFNERALNIKSITNEDMLLAPGMFLVFTEDPLTIKSHYPKAVDASLVKVLALPALPDEFGSVAILDDQQRIIDLLEYKSEYHSVFLKEKEGVSLERISVEQSNDAYNWKSASADVGFATPGYINSNTRGEINSGEVVINPEVFEPIVGQPDFTQIQYNFKQGGNVASIKIVDYQGRIIKTIANNVTLGTNGFFRWDGDTDDATKARTGYYMVWLEVFNVNGNVETFRKRVIIASRK